ncbi:TPA: hypothetical protein N0F65_002452 [Lagenidium giganteum]|uniref:Uncharacterized protein n=1 Tax=Lagenidium giganteum TaxID=4803 RepID=A0AAV2YNI1_9STRA|nr:TPA: hypothetical protein N0F65_002452 [Lagenidium giganteum]
MQRAAQHALRALRHPQQRRMTTTVGSSSCGPLRHNFADPKIGIGYLQLSPEEMAAEQELLQFLPDFQQAIDVLHGSNEDRPLLSNSKKAALALPQLERTADICRASMGFKSAYLAAALRHLFLTYFMQGNYKMANKIMEERGDLMDWPITEQERILRLFLRQNKPELGFEWAQREVFTTLFPANEILPLKWTSYELIGKSLQNGGHGLDVDDPMFTKAVEVLRCKKDLIKQEGGAANDSLTSREIPYLLSQYAALCLVASDSLCKPFDELSDQQQIALNQAEILWKEALTWVEKTATEDSKEEITTGVDAPFEAWIQTNLGELLLQKKQPEDAMEYLGKALQTQQNEKASNALALTRVLSKIAQGCHSIGQAVSSEGLFTTVLETYEKEGFLSLTDQVEYANALRAYGNLLANWEKREGGAKQKIDLAKSVEDSIASQCSQLKCTNALHPVFYLPL